MHRHIAMSMTAAGVLAAALAGLASLAQPADAQDDPTRQWLVCWGPLPMGRLSPPKKVYVSGVSTAIRVTGQTYVLITDAFHAFIQQKYGADFTPRCEGYGTEDMAKRQVKTVSSGGMGAPGEATGWVWTQPDSDKAIREAPKPKPGALEH
jgi:hypothetical protein